MGNSVDWNLTGIKQGSYCAVSCLSKYKVSLSFWFFFAFLANTALIALKSRNKIFVYFCHQRNGTCTLKSNSHGTKEPLTPLWNHSSTKLIPLTVSAAHNSKQFWKFHYRWRIRIHSRLFVLKFGWSWGKLNSFTIPKLRWCTLLTLLWLLTRKVMDRSSQISLSATLFS